MQRSLTSAVIPMAMLIVMAPIQAANQTATITPVITNGNLPYRVQLHQFDGARELSRPAVHSFVAGEYDGQWIILGGSSNGLHGFDIDRTSIPERFQNAEIWVIDPTARNSWSRSLVPEESNSGLTNEQLLSLTASNAQFEQIGDRLYVTGGFGDNDVADPTGRDTFGTLSALDLPELVNWAKGGAGTAASHIRQVNDPLFKVTGGAMAEIDGKMHLVFGQDFNEAYQGNRFDGTYTHQVRTFTILDDGNQLNFSEIQSSAPAAHFRRRDLNVYPTLQVIGDSLTKGITALSGVFTESRGAWTVPIEIDSTGSPLQIDYGNDPLNSDSALDNDLRVFKQGMNNYHSAKLGLFSEQTGAMHELLFGGITLQQYLPDDPAADEHGFVTDPQLPNTNQISSVVRHSDGAYQQYYLGTFPELFTDEVVPRQMRFGSNAEFFVADAIPTFDNGVIDFDRLPGGDTMVGYIFGGLITNAPHVFGDPAALSSASGEIFTVVLTKTVPEPSSLLLLIMTAAVAIVVCRRSSPSKPGPR